MPQFLAGGIARGLRPTETLAAFALAWGLADMLASPMSQVRQLGLVLVNTPRQALQVLRFVSVCGIALAAVLAFLAWSSTGRFVIERWHDASPHLADVVRFALLWLIPYPLLESWNRWLAGLLMRVRRTDIVSAGMFGGIGAGVLTVLVAVSLPVVQEQPIALPLLVTYVSLATNLSILLIGNWLIVRPRLRSAPGEDHTDLSVSYVAAFFWPLALTMAIQGLSRPAINLFVSRGPSGEEALAALAVIYSLAHLPYGWLNELRSLPAAFAEFGSTGQRHVRRFSLGCGLLSFGAMAAAFLWPVPRDMLLLDVLALPPAVAERCHGGLALFCFFPLAVAVRSYMHGVALKERRTASLAPSAPARIGAILLILLCIPVDWVQGATLGVAALLSGFVLEAFVAWWFVHVRRPADGLSSTAPNTSFTA